jgi:FkbM family methyltransferase
MKYMNFINEFINVLFKIRFCGKRLGVSIRFIPPKTKMPILFRSMRGNKWIVDSAPYTCWLGIFEYEKRILFEKTVMEGSVVFDIGAHVGFYTLLSSLLVGPKGRVFAFEPVPKNISYLREHVRLNQATNVTIIEAAVTDFDGLARFKENEDSTKGHLEPEGGLEVETVSLDRLISRGKTPFPQFMKIDVEGSEMLVLSGSRSIIAKAHPTIFLSTHSSYLHQRCCQFLTSLGYALKAINGKAVSLSDEILAYYPRSRKVIHERRLVL